MTFTPLHLHLLTGCSADTWRRLDQVSPRAGESNNLTATVSSVRCKDSAITVGSQAKMKGELSTSCLGSS